jgi:hypothetical protein
MRFVAPIELLNKVKYRNKDIICMPVVHFFSELSSVNFAAEMPRQVA